MKNTIRKLFSLLLCLVMVFSLFPVVALADHEADADPELNAPSKPDRKRILFSAPAEGPLQEFKKRQLTQNYDEDTAVAATLDNLALEGRLVIEVIDRKSSTSFSEYRISVDEEDRVERIEHYVEGVLKTTRWLSYESGQLTSYTIELNSQWPERLSGLDGSSCVLSNTEGELWLWGGPGAPKPFDTTDWEAIDWSTTTIMDSFDMYTLNLYSPDPFFLDYYYSVFPGSLYLSNEGTILGLDLFDFNYSDGLTYHSYDNTLAYVMTYQYDEAQGAWVSHYDNDWDQFVELRDELTPAEDWSNASRYITVCGVEQAVFLDSRGRTVRLLLRSLNSGEICADYRFDWTDDQIHAITRLDEQGTKMISHVFQYDDDNALFCDRITSVAVSYCDYTITTESWTDWQDALPNETGEIELFNDDVDTREVYIDGQDGTLLENLGIYRDGNIFRLIMFDGSSNDSIIDVHFNMGTLNGLKGGTLFTYAFTTSELDETENAWVHTSYDENWNVIG